MNYPRPVIHYPSGGHQHRATSTTSSTSSSPTTSHHPIVLASQQQQQHPLTSYTYQPPVTSNPYHNMYTSTNDHAHNNTTATTTSSSASSSTTPSSSTTTTATTTQPHPSTVMNRARPLYYETSSSPPIASGSNSHQRLLNSDPLLEPSIKGEPDTSTSSSPSSPNKTNGTMGTERILPVKARSIMACVLCRKQKMKCEGPDKAPCKRCRNAQVECTFESPIPSLPRANRTGHGTSSRASNGDQLGLDSYLESRFEKVEQRIRTLEISSPQQHQSLTTTTSSSSALVGEDRSRSNIEHERRIRALEAQVYALRLASHSTSSSGQNDDRFDDDFHGRRYNGSGSGSGPGTGGGGGVEEGARAFKANYNPNPFPSIQHSSNGVPSTIHHHHHQQQRPNFPSLGRKIDYPLHHTNGIPSSSSGLGSGFETRDDEMRSTKRWKGEEIDERIALTNGHGFAVGVGGREEDLITRGIVKEEEASMCYDSYFLNFAHRPTVIKSGAATSTPRLIDLPFAATRQRSPLLFATIVSIGARSLSRMETYHASLNEAIRLSRATFLPEPETETTSLDFKGIMLLSLYNGMHDLMSHGIALSYKFNLPTALEEYEALSAEEQSSKQGEILALRGRTFLTSFLWTSFYSYCRARHGAYHIPDEVIRHQLDVLEASPYTQQPSDRGIRVNAEECLIIRQVFDRLGTGMRIKKPSYEEAVEIIERGIENLLEWNRRYEPMMELITQWGDDAELKTVVPFHHGRMSMLMWIFRDLDFTSPEEELNAIRNRPKMFDFSKQAIESAMVIFKWGVESRIWLPHSMVAQYLFFVNIPTAVQLLFNASRLFPSLANFQAIRKVLHRLLKQCDNCIAANVGTRREIVRAQETRALVLEFDLYAFNAAWYEEEAEGANQNGANGANGSNNKEEVGLFGDEISASLDSMSLELNLWGSILVGALDD